MEGRNVIVLEIHLDEGLPVVVARLDLDPIEHVAREVEVAGCAHALQVACNVALALEQQAVPVLQGRVGELHARLVLEQRRAHQATLEIVRPAMDGTDDVGGVAPAVEHDRLPVAADVRQQFDAVGAAHQNLRIVAPGEGVIVAYVGHHQFVTHIGRPAVEQHLLFESVHCGIAIPGNRELRGRRPQPVRSGEVRHQPVLFVNRQPNNQYKWRITPPPNRFAKSAIYENS